MSSTDNRRVIVLNSRTKQILFIASVGAIVVAAMVMIYAILVTPSRQPYRDALAQYQNVYNANLAVMTRGTSLNASTATNEQFTTNTEAVKTALASLKIENDALGKHAVLTSGEGRERYDVFTKKLNTYIAFNSDILLAMQQVRPVIFECSKSMKNISENGVGVDAMVACSTNLKALTSVPNEDYQTFVHASHGLYSEFATNLQAKAALADPKGADVAQAKALDDEQSRILKALNTASATFSSSLKQHKQAVDITDAAMTLDNYLHKKSNIF